MIKKYLRTLQPAESRLMRQPILIILPLLALWFPVATSAVTLTETNGVPITGNISSFSTRTGLVKINQAGRMTTRPLAALTTESQEMVILWLADKNFQRNSNLNTTFRPSYTESSSNVVGTITDAFTLEKSEKTIGSEIRNTCTYKIALKNESDTSFKNLIVDYRIFFTQRLTSENIGQYQLAGHAEYDTLSPGTTWNFETNPFVSSIIHRSARGIRWGSHPPDTESTILGILLRIRKPGLSEDWVEQEIEHGEIPRKRDRADYQKIYK